MLEPNVEKKIDGPEVTVQRLTQQLRKLQEESRILQEKNAESEKKYIREMEDRYAQESIKLQHENAEKVNILISDLEINHALEIQKVKEDHQAWSRALVIAFLKAKTERDRILMVVSLIAVGALTIIVFGSLLHEGFSRILTYVALAGFVGAILSVAKNFKYNSEHLRRTIEGEAQSDPIWEQDDSKPLRFLTLGFISAILLGLNLFINSPVKFAVLPQTTDISDKGTLPLGTKTSDSVEKQSDASPTASASVKENINQSTEVTVTSLKTTSVTTDTSVKTASSTDKTTGNGGNFVGGTS